jgi:hypothetical protein
MLQQEKTLKRGTKSKRFLAALDEAYLGEHYPFLAARQE